jgi:hypothetical protein
MEVKSYFKAPEGYVYVNHTLHLFGEIIYSTDEVEYTENDFTLVKEEELETIINQWRSEHGNTE